MHSSTVQSMLSRFSSIFLLLCLFSAHATSDSTLNQITSSLTQNDLFKRNDTTRTRRCTTKHGSDSTIHRLSISQPFITKDPQPVNFRMHLFNYDDGIGSSAVTNKGNNMFEMAKRGKIYQRLKGVMPYKSFTNPIFMDVGANVGMFIIYFYIYIYFFWSCSVYFCIS